MDLIPQELLERILWYLVPSTSKDSLKSILDSKETIGSERKTLYNVMVSCKSFYHTARPLFYHTISFEDHHLEITRIQRLIQICIEQPDTASYVREICLGEWGCSLCDIHCHEKESFDLESFQRAVERTNVTLQLRADIQVALEQGSHAAAVALLFSLCVNVNTINTTHCFIESSLIYRLAEESTMQSVAEAERDRLHVAGGIRPLQRLRTFRMRCSLFEQFIDLTSFIPYFRLPFLELFEGVGVQGDKRFSDLLSSFKSDMRFLKISNVAVDSAALDWLLAACPGLVEIEIDIWNAWGRCEPAPDAIGDVFRRHGSRVQGLVIRHWRKRDLAIDGDLDDKVLGCLTTMDELHILHVSWDMLFGHTLFNDNFSTYRAAPGYLKDTLPHSLMELGISLTPQSSIYIQFLDQQLQTLMESEQFKELHLIRVCRTEPFSLQCPLKWCSRVNKSRPDRWGSIRTNVVLWRESGISIDFSIFV